MYLHFCCCCCYCRDHICRRCVGGSSCLTGEEICLIGAQDWLQGPGFYLPSSQGCRHFSLFSGSCQRARAVRGAGTGASSASHAVRLLRRKGRECTPQAGERSGHPSHRDCGGGRWRNHGTDDTDSNDYTTCFACVYTVLMCEQVFTLTMHML
jgi:hypothetical protein